MDPRIYTSAKTGNICLLKELLNENPSLILKLTPHGNTPLHIAVQYGHKKIIAETYRRRPSLLTQPNLDGDTPLHVAARLGPFDTVHFLVSKALSSCLNVENGRNWGIDILRLGNKENNTVLHEAVRNRQPEVVGLLLKVDPGLACFHNKSGESPLYLAARDGMVDVVNRILVNAQFAHSGSNGQTALHVAIAEKHFEIIEALLRTRPQLIKETDCQGKTPLHYAAYLGDHRTVGHILELDTGVAYASDKDGQSPIHLAAREGHTKVIEKLIHCCPDSGEMVDLSGQNALHAAILNGKTNVVRYMLDTKEVEGLISQADCDGNTPLHLATAGRKTWIVRYLIGDGRVDPRAKNRIGKTALGKNELICDRNTTYPRTSNKQKQLNFPRTSKESSASEGTVKTYGKMGHTLLMVATLIATVTFAAVFTIPGGYNNNVGPDQGLALLRRSKHFVRFVLSSSLAMTCSITAICIILWGAVIAARESYVYYFASALLLIYIAIHATGSAFISGVIAVIPYQSFFHIISPIIGIAFHISTCLFLLQLVKIFSLYELYQLLAYRFCKLMTKFIK